MVPTPSANQSSKALTVASLALCAAVAAVLFVSNIDSKPSALFSETIQFSNGHQAELSRHDFVPLSRNGASPDSLEARHQMAGLYQAAGVRMKDPTPASRQQELAEVFLSHLTLPSKSLSNNRLLHAVFTYSIHPKFKSGVFGSPLSSA